jgi:DHA3 family macrolide efflux protein-like MFS transporter
VTREAKRSGVRELLGHPGSRTFLWLALGQSVSLFGTHFTAFALGVWLFEETGAATPLALSVLAGFLPGVLLGPYAGVVVDRVNRKWAMMFSDLAQGVATLAILSLLAAGVLTPLMIYGLLALSSTAGAFQYPALASTISLLVPKAHLGRANGVLSFGEGVGSLAAPFLAGVLVPTIGVSGVMLIDVATFVFSAAVLLLLSIPNPVRHDPDRAAERKALGEMLEGWRYITRRPGLLGLLLIGSLLNLIGIFVSTRLSTPLVLARSGGDTVALGLVSSAFGAGLIVGGLVMASWGGPRRRIYGVLGSMIAIGLCYQVLFSLGQQWPIWVLASFLGPLFIPIQSGSSQAIWQAKVSPEVQGRVFALRYTVGQFLTPVGLVLVGPLADRVAEPLMNGPLGVTLAPLFGMGPGRGFALVMLCFGLLTVLIAIIGLSLPRVRKLEQELPDAAAVVDEAPATAHA